MHFLKKTNTIVLVGGMFWVHLYVNRHLKRDRNEVEYIIIKYFDNFNFVLIFVFRIHNIFVYYSIITVYIQLDVIIIYRFEWKELTKLLE